MNNKNRLILTEPILFTLKSKERKGVFTNPIARANKSPHVGGFSALVVDHTPAGGFSSGPGVIPHPDIFKLENLWNYIGITFASSDYKSFRTEQQSLNDNS